MAFNNIFRNNTKLLQKKTKNIFVLSVSGRGSRAYINTLVLKEIEKELRMQGLSKKLTSYFDVHTGSSLGGLILSLHLLDSYSSEEIADFFKKEFKNFLKLNEDVPPQFLLGKSVKYKYSSSYMISCLRGMFGTIHFDFFQHPLLLQCYDILNLEPFECNESNAGNIELYKILLATISTPFYLSPVYFKEGDFNDSSDLKLCESCFFSMHPAMSAYAYVMKHLQDANIYILSIGDGRQSISASLSEDTSTEQTNTQYTKNSMYGWPVFSPDTTLLQMIENNLLEYKEQFFTALPHVFHFEINGYMSKYKEISYYDFSDAYLDYLEKNAYNIIHQNRLEIKSFVSKLKEFKKPT